MPDAAGAYAKKTGTIYLNQAWIQTASHKEIIKVLTEEYGHHLDALLNQDDTKGDEGKLFSDLLNEINGSRASTHQPSARQLSDHGAIKFREEIIPTLNV